MPDSEWYAVVTQDGIRLADQLPNIEAAKEFAREAAPASVGILTVVRYTRTELCTMERQITIKETPSA